MTGLWYKYATLSDKQNYQEIVGFILNISTSVQIQKRLEPLELLGACFLWQSL